MSSKPNKKRSSSETTEDIPNKRKEIESEDDEDLEDSDDESEDSEEDSSDLDSDDKQFINEVIL